MTMLQTKVVLELRACALPASDLIAATVDGPTRCKMMRSGSHCPGLSIIPESPPNKFCLDWHDEAYITPGSELSDAALQADSEQAHASFPSKINIMTARATTLQVEGCSNLEDKEGRRQKARMFLGVCIVSLAVMGAAVLLDHFSLADHRNTLFDHMQLRARLLKFLPMSVHVSERSPGTPPPSWKLRWKRLF